MIAALFGCAIQDMYVYIDTSPTVRFDDESSLVWYEESIPLAGTPEELTMDVELPTTGDMRFNNGTVYVHAHFARSGMSPNPESEDYSKFATFGVTSRTYFFMSRFLSV